MNNFIRKRIKEFKEFHDLLMLSAPRDYIPHYFAVCSNDKNPDSKYIKEYSGKGYSWKEKYAILDYKQALKCIESGRNIGLGAMSYDPLIIIDIDSEKYFDSLKSNTLIDKSRKRCGFHAYYWKDESDTKLPLNIPLDNIGELRSKDQYVLVPGSYVTTDKNTIKKELQDNNITSERYEEILKDELLGYYTVFTKKTPDTITYDELPLVFREENERVIGIQNLNQNSYSAEKSALFKLKMTDLVKEKITPRMAHPLHGSDTGSNFSISSDNNFCHCWRHNVTLTPVQFLAVKYGIMECHKAGKGHNNSGVGKSELKKTDILKIWERAKSENIIPYDDVKPFEKKPLGLSKNTNINYDIISEQAEKIILQEKIFLDELNILWTIDKKGVLRDIKASNNSVFYHKLIFDNLGTVSALDTNFRVPLENALKIHARNNYYKNILIFNKINEKNKYVFFENKKLNVFTGELEDYTGDEIIVNKIEHNIDADDDTPKIDKIIKEVTNQKPEYIKDLIAYLIYPFNPEKAIIFWHGKRDAGKSSVTAIIDNFIGKDNTISSNYSMISNEKERFEIINLRNKLVCYVPEIGGKGIYDTEQIKAISGNDWLRGEKKGVTGNIQFKTPVKLLIQCNHLPQPKDETDDAFTSRCLIYDFPNTFQRSLFNDLDKIPIDEYSKLARYCVNKIKFWSQKNKIDLYGVKNIDDRKKEYLRRTNPFISFFNENIEIDKENDLDFSTYNISCADFNNSFNLYLENRGLATYDYRRIGQLMKKNFEGYYLRKQVRVFDNHQWYYYGIKLKEQKQENLEGDFINKWFEKHESLTIDDVLNSDVNHTKVIEKINDLQKKGLIYESKPRQWRPIK